MNEKNVRMKEEWAHADYDKSIMNKRLMLLAKCKYQLIKGSTNKVSLKFDYAN